MWLVGGSGKKAAMRCGAVRFDAMGMRWGAMGSNAENAFRWGKGADGRLSVSA